MIAISAPSAPAPSMTRCTTVALPSRVIVDFFSTASKGFMDRPFVQIGIGMSRHFLCMGCHHTRPPLGSRGTGVRKRCAQCVGKGTK